MFSIHRGTLDRHRGGAMEEGRRGLLEDGNCRSFVGISGHRGFRWHTQVVEEIPSPDNGEMPREIVGNVQVTEVLHGLRVQGVHLA